MNGYNFTSQILLEWYFRDINLAKNTIESLFVAELEFELASQDCSDSRREYSHSKIPVQRALKARANSRILALFKTCGRGKSFGFRFLGFLCARMGAGKIFFDEIAKARC